MLYCLVQVLVLGRGQFVGERAVINDRLRTADCVAEGDVEAVVLKKKVGASDGTGYGHLSY
jgi:CRP-like cAMP-binding protein